MNNQSPLVPQGSLLEQKNKGRARVKIAVFFVLTIHGVALLALLMQGCQKEKETAKTDQSTPAAPTFDSTNAQVPEVIGAVPPTNPPSMPESAAIPAAPAAVSEYTVVQGDTFSTIAKKFKSFDPAVIAANPGANPQSFTSAKSFTSRRRLRLLRPVPGRRQRQYPLLPPENPAGGEQLYTVKSGDNLTKIGGNSAFLPKPFVVPTA